MIKHLLLVTTGAACALSAAFAADAPASAAAPPPPAWVAESNADAQALLRAIAQFQPEFASRVGLSDYDEKTADLAANYQQRERTALDAARSALQKRLGAATDVNVKQDLAILIKSADRRIETSRLDEKYLLPYRDVGELIFQGQFVLLQDQIAAERRVKALPRLKCYVGLGNGCTPVTKLVEAAFEKKLADKNLLGPFKDEVEQHLANTERYASGVRQLYAKYKIDGADAALDALQKQLQDHDAWVKSTVLPHARVDYRLPPELYANNLKNVGIDIDPHELIRRAQLEFVETRAQMQVLAPTVAKAAGSSATDYRDVLKLLKKKQLGKDSIESYYHGVIGKIEAIIREHDIVTLPQREMIMRLASEAETAQQPAPHMMPPPLLNNHGERGSFILPLGNPGKAGDKTGVYDDFTCEACAWTLTAHEGRPGHELQFSAMVEHGVSLARSLFAFNSVNVEGWALYAEFMMVPYEPADGQMIALQLRLQRAARAMLDPMLNLGEISYARAHDILTNDVGLSEAFAKEELDRFTFRAPGQANAYFYGYTHLLQLREHVELVAGTKFDLKALNDFILEQGLLPPDQLADAVEKQFLPRYAATAH
jgi:uncharacterized protein (DUF885 family)